MRTTRHIALAAALAAPVLGSVTCTGPAPVLPPWAGGTADLLHWLVEVANRPEEPGTYTYPCPHGGEVEVTVATSEEQEDRLSGEWEIELDECGPGGAPGNLVTPGRIFGDPTIPDGHFAFTSETVFLESGRRRLEAAVEAEFSWIWGRGYDPSGRLWLCHREGTDISGVFEAGLDEPYTGSLEGIICGGPGAGGDPVEIPVSEFPGI